MQTMLGRSPRSPESEFRHVYRVIRQPLWIGHYDYHSYIRFLSVPGPVCPMCITTLNPTTTILYVISSLDLPFVMTHLCMQIGCTVYFCFLWFDLTNSSIAAVKQLHSCSKFLFIDKFIQDSGTKMTARPFDKPTATQHHIRKASVGSVPLSLVVPL